MQDQEGNEECQSHYNEKRQAGDPGSVPRLWDQDVQNRKELVESPKVGPILPIGAVARLPSRVHSNPMLPRLDDPKRTRFRLWCTMLWRCEEGETQRVRVWTGEGPSPKILQQQTAHPASPAMERKDVRTENRHNGRGNRRRNSGVGGTG